MTRGKAFQWATAWALAGCLWVHAAATESSRKSEPASHRKAAGTAQIRNKLDTVAIRKYYLDGEFDIAIESLEDALKYGGPFSHQDSVFIMKHLGVMHTATYETREKGKRYFMELLNIEPTAKIMDMYASDMIYMIFKNLRDEFESRNPHRFAGPEKRPESGDEPQLATQKTKKSYAWLGWTVGAATVTGGALLALYLVDQKPEPEPTPETVEHTSND